MSVSGMLIACAVGFTNPSLQSVDPMKCEHIWELAGPEPFDDLAECQAVSRYSLDRLAKDKKTREDYKAPTADSLNDGRIPVYFFECKEGDKVMYNSLVEFQKNHPTSPGTVVPTPPKLNAK